MSSKSADETSKKKKQARHCGGETKPAGDSPFDSEKMRRRQIWLQDVGGIAYIFDANFNVYNVYDVVRDVVNPRIVGRWSNEDETFHVDIF